MSPGFSFNTWVINPGPVLSSNFEPVVKHDVLVRRVELLEANHNYTVIKDSRGTTRTVSTKDLAPVTERVTEQALDNDENQEANDEPVNEDETGYREQIKDAENRVPELSLQRLEIP